MKALLLFAATLFMALTFAGSCLAQDSETGSERSPEDSTKITLTIGETVIPAILYNTPPARELMERLPVTVSLNRGPVDYCGGIEPITYGEDDVQVGYRSGDLAYWTPGQDFVIFTETEESSSGEPTMVILGHISVDVEDVRDLGSTIEVTIALEKNEPNELEDKTAMQIRVKTNGNTVVFDLNDSTAAKALYAQLPLSITVENFSNNEKIFYPSEKLDTTDTPLAKNIQAGTLAYYAPWGDVVMFYGSFSSAAGLYELGHAISGSEHIQGMSGTIEIEKGSAP